MKADMSKAEITAFLSMVFVLLVSFVLGILEISVIQTSGNVSRLTVDRAIFSIFGEYQREMFEDYSVFAIDGSYGSKEYDEEYLTDRMRYYGTAGIEHEITGIQYLTDNGGQAFREQVLEHMETKYGLSMIRDLTGMTSEWKEESIQGEQMAGEQQGIMDKVESLREAAALPDETLPDTDGGRTDTPDTGAQIETEGNPFTCLEQIEKSGVLSVVMPKDMELSGLGIDTSDQASVRTLRSGKGTFPIRQGTGGIEERLLFDEYVLMNFTNAVQTSAQNSGNATEQVSDDKDRSLAYEVEYILEGKATDKENLEAVLMQLFLIRMALNYAYLLSDQTKQAEVTVLAVTITTVLLIPGAAEVVKQLILLAWAAGESVVDIRTLLSGKRTALMKNSDNWQLSLSSLLTLGSDSEQSGGEDVPGGISYEDYLRAFLFLKDTDDITMRTLDRIEENLASEYGLEHIRMDRCVTKLEIKNTARIFGGLTYTFPVYFGYE